MSEINKENENVSGFDDEEKAISLTGYCEVFVLKEKKEEED